MQQFKPFCEALSWTCLVTSLAGWLPPIAALFSIVWTGIQIYGWWKRRK